MTAVGASNFVMRMSCWRRGGLVAGRELRNASVVCWLVAAVGLCAARPVAAQPAISIFDRQPRQAAIEAIPFDKLTEAAQAKLWKVVSKPSLYRQLPVTVIEADPDLYLTLVRYPEVVVNMWQIMGVTKVDVGRTGPFSFDAEDGAGTVCKVDLIYGDRNTHVFYAEGTYEGKLLKNLIGGKCVMVLQSKYARTQDKEVYVTSRLDMFVQLDNVGAELIARTLHPLVGKAADHNFTESMKFLGQVSHAAAKKTKGLQRLSTKLTNIDDDVREKFLLATDAANDRAIRRAASASSATDDKQTTSVIAAPVITAGSRLDEARADPTSSSIRKPLSLRR